MITPRPGPSNSIPKPGFPMIPFFGIEPVLMTEDVSLYCQYPSSVHSFIYLSPQGKEIEGNDVTGNLCIRHPWPAMARTIYGDHEKYVNTYFTKYPGII